MVMRGKNTRTVTPRRRLPPSTGRPRRMLSTKARLAQLRARMAVSTSAPKSQGAKGWMAPSPTTGTIQSPTRTRHTSIEEPVMSPMNRRLRARGGAGKVLGVRGMFRPLRDRAANTRRQRRGRSWACPPPGSGGKPSRRGRHRRWPGHRRPRRAWSPGRSLAAAFRRCGRDGY
ncbi:MAG: hypothetical protein PWP17_915 [Desulfomicrobiaceae bacterium]|nr:hypothetical protein [Desulfomicrobiaceae bacterium]